MKEPVVVTVVKRNVSLYHTEWDIVQSVNDRLGLHNISAALRFIINEFHTRQNQLPLPLPLPKPSEES